MKYLKLYEEYISRSIADEKFLEENPEYIDDEETIVGEYNPDEIPEGEDTEYMTHNNVHNSMYSGIKNSGRQNLSRTAPTNIGGSNGK